MAVKWCLHFGAHTELLHKLSRANALLFQVRNFVNSSILRTIYFTIFESHFNYCSFVWSQNCNAINQLVMLQKKLLESLPFSHITLTLILYSKVLFWNSQIVTLENTLFVSKSINNPSLSLFNDWFLFSSDQYNYETSWCSLGNIHKPSYKTNLYDKNSIIARAINA